MNQNYDHRAAAYVGAVERIKAAESVRAAVHGAGGHEAPLPDVYWANVAEAAVFADLARADLSVGIIAGNYLTDQGERDHAIVRCPDHSIAPCGSFIYDKDRAKIECDQRFSHSGMHSHHATNTYWGSTIVRPEDVK